MFSNDKNVETIGQLVETIKHYIGLQKEYLKLDVVDKVVRLLTAFTITLVLLGRECQGHCQVCQFRDEAASSQVCQIYHYRVGGAR